MAAPELHAHPARRLHARVRQQGTRPLGALALGRSERYERTAENDQGDDQRAHPKPQPTENQDYRSDVRPPSGDNECDKRTYDRSQQKANRRAKSRKPGADQHSRDGTEKGAHKHDEAEVVPMRADGSSRG